MGRSKGPERNEMAKDPSQYPNEIFTAQTKKDTFSIEAHFVRRQEDEGKPMMVFSEPLSRFKFTLIEGGKAIYANLPVSKAAGAYMNTMAASKIYLSEKFSPAAPDAVSLSPAFTVRFFSGNLKGKSPVEVLIQDAANGRAALQSQSDWLMSNLDRYPKNQALIDAINEALSLPEDKLKEASVSAPAAQRGIAEIISEDIRPLIRTKNASGKSLCYSLHVLFDPTRKYPVAVQIVNFYAPVRKNEDGTLNVLSGGDLKEDVSKFQISLSMDDWVQAADMIHLARQSFYTASFPSAYNKAREISDKARTEAKRGQAEQAEQAQ